MAQKCQHPDCNNYAVITVTTSIDNLYLCPAHCDEYLLSKEEKK